MWWLAIEPLDWLVQKASATAKVRNDHCTVLRVTAGTPQPLIHIQLTGRWAPLRTKSCSRASSGTGMSTPHLACGWTSRERSAQQMIFAPTEFSLFPSTLITLPIIPTPLDNSCVPQAECPPDLQAMFGGLRRLRPSSEAPGAASATSLATQQSAMPGLHSKRSF